MTTRRPSFRRYFAAGLLCAGAAVAVAAAPFLTPPRPGRPAGLVFRPGVAPERALAAVIQSDPAARLIDLRWNGLVLFVTYADPAFPAAIRRLGALHLFDAVAAGCHAPS